VIRFVNKLKETLRLFQLWR